MALCKYLEDCTKCPNFAPKTDNKRDEKNCFQWKRDFLGRGQHWCDYIDLRK